jgi:hypothetical protein
MRWKHKGFVHQAAVTVEGLAELFHRQSSALDPWFTASDAQFAKGRFAQEVLTARAAFEQYYDLCREAFDRRSRTELDSLDLHAGMTEPDYHDVSKELAFKRLAHESMRASTVAERHAGALLQQASEIVEALVGELTDNTKPVGAGRTMHGVSFDDALKACGNFTRHKAEWARSGRLSRELKQMQLTSIRAIGKLLTHDAGCADARAFEAVLYAREPMRQCLFTLAGLDADQRRPYKLFEADLIELGSDIVDRCWPIKP